MKNNMKNIILILVAAGVGLGAGYFMFGNKQAAEPMAEHEHEHADEAAAEQIWTCSMHPQIRRNEPGQCPICGMDLIPAGSSTASDNPLVMEMTQTAVKLANIQTVEVGYAGSAGTTKSIFLTGKIQPDERLSASQVSHVPGRIEQLFVTFTGETIKKGQKLATIYSPELVSAQRELLEALKWKDTRPQLLEAARNKLRYWKISDSMIEEIEKSGEVQSNITVFADKAGIVTKRHIAVGDYVKEGGVLFDMVNLSRLWVLFDAYEEDLANVRIGDKVEYTVASLPGQVFRARISFIDPLINPQTRVASLRAEVVNSRRILKPDMFVKGTITARTGGGGKTALTVPKTAVLWTGNRSVVYVAVPDASVPSYEYREIEVGDAVGRDYLIEKGLEAGDRVVVNGAFVIDAAAQLNNRASMMNRSVKERKPDDVAVDFSAETSNEFRAQLSSSVQEYLALKDAFVNTDPETAKAEATKFLTSLGNIQMELLKGDAHLYWMEKLKTMKGHGAKISESDDVEEQRKQFSYLTEALVESMEAFGTVDTLFVQHCPMAMDGNGADWISNEEEVKNPYYGEKMLTCGSVKITFPLEHNDGEE